MYEDRKFAIVDAVGFQTAVGDGSLDVELLFEKILETNLNTLRYNVAQTEFVIKSDDPDAMAYLRGRAIELGIGYTEYTYEEILVELQKEAWNPEEEII